MIDQLSLKNQFLIAMPNMDDPFFYHSVTYICEHNAEGAIGLIINHPTKLSMVDFFNQMDLTINDTHELKNTPIFTGGPIQPERGFVIHRPKGHWQSTLTLTKDVAITTSKDILAAIANHEGPNDHIIALGYAGWESGQLEDELAKNVWLSGPADPAILFNTPYVERWKSAAHSLGIDIERLSGDIGHA